MKDLRDRDRRLREALRAGDPAAEDGELAPFASAAMRQRILASAHAPGRGKVWARGRAWRLALPTGLATLAAAVLVAVIVHHRDEVEMPPPTAASRSVAAPAVGPDPVATGPAAPDRMALVPPSVASPAAAARPEARRAPRHAVDRPSSPRSSIQPAVAREARRLEMQTPGGTRIVWVLDPDLTL